MAGSTMSIPFAIPQRYRDCTITELKALCGERKLKTTGKAKRDDLITRLSKYETQARVYDGWTLNQLLKEVQARRLDYTTAVSCADLIGVLEAADKARTFDRFLDLPAELRNRIYRFATVSDPSVALVRPRVPAVCQASHQLRRESLPIYYGVNSFAINLKAAVYEKVPQHRIKLVLEGSVDGRDAKWLNMVDQAGTAEHLRRLLFVVAKSEVRRTPYTCSEIVFKGGMARFEVIGRGVWEGTTYGMARLVGVEGEGHDVALPSELTSVLERFAQDGRGMSLDVVKAMLVCLLKESRCYIKR